jgi:hypothetical protein
MNLTDFLNEVEQDLKGDKYHLELADLQIIADSDIERFLQKLTDNFNLEKIKTVYKDIRRWEYMISPNDDDDKLPYITKQIKRQLIKKAGEYSYKKTCEHLLENPDYREKEIEILSSQNEILVAIFDGYNDAICDSEKNINNIAPKQSDLFDVIDAYFKTFETLHLSLMQFIMNYHTENVIYSEVLANNDFFIVDSDTVTKRIAIELNNNQSNPDTIKRYITRKYINVTESLESWTNDYSDYMSLPFSVYKEYTDNAVPAKILFFCCVEFFGTKANPIQPQPTIADYYYKILQELESGYDTIMAFLQKAGENPDVIEQPKLVQNSQPEIVEPEKPSRTFDVAKIAEIYKFCIDTGVIDEDIIPNMGFMNAVSQANFKTIYAHAEHQKSKRKCRYVIYVLSKLLGGEWYLEAAHSIDTEPTKCSGANVPAEWKRKALAIK